MVIDNPPFSCISKIAAFYKEHGIDYFLFAPDLTMFNIRAARSRICVGYSVTYQNGARVRTGFISSQGPLIRSAPELYRILKAADEENRHTKAVTLPKYSYPDNVMTASAVDLMSKHGIDYREDVGVFTRTLDAQREKKKAIFGCGFIVPMAAARKAQEATRQARNVTDPSSGADFVWRLSERENNELAELEKVSEGKKVVSEP